MNRNRNDNFLEQYLERGGRKSHFSSLLNKCIKKGNFLYDKRGRFDFKGILVSPRRLFTVTKDSPKSHDNVAARQKMHRDFALQDGSVKKTDQSGTTGK